MIHTLLGEIFIFSFYNCFSLLVFALRYNNPTQDGLLIQSSLLALKAWCATLLENVIDLTPLLYEDDGC